MLSEFLVRAQQWRDFATAHSCGLRRFASVFINQPEAFATAHSCGLRRCRSLMTSAFATFASAHSCGLRQRKTRHYVESNSLPQRIRAGCDSLRPCRCSLHRSLPQRIRAGCDSKPQPIVVKHCSLPQRIRAGCDLIRVPFRDFSYLCLSAFVRVAT